MTLPQPRLLLLPVLAAALFVAGCGDDGGSDETSKTTTSTGQRTPAPTERTRRDNPNDQGGARVAAGGGSALLGAPADAGVTTAAASGIRPFSEDSPWNTVVQGAPVDGNSAKWIEQARIRIGVREEGNRVETQRIVVTEGVYINTRGFTTPVVNEENGVVTRVVCRQQLPQCGDGATVETLQIPPGTDPDPAYDGWFTVLDRPNGVAYDLWRARRGKEDEATMSYQFMRKWDLNGPGFLEPGTVSARGSGLPLFAGLLLPEEIESGRINHALAISLPGPARRRYVQPASSTDGNGSTSSIPEGARVRLKANVTLDLEKLDARTNTRAARAIYDALRRYGAILVDRARVPTLYAKRNFDWAAPLRDDDGELLNADGRALSRFVKVLPNQGTPLLRGSEVDQLKVEDFEVVRNQGPVLNYPPLGTKAAATPLPVTSAAPDTASDNRAAPSTGATP